MRQLQKLVSGISYCDGCGTYYQGYTECSKCPDPTPPPTTPTPTNPYPTPRRWTIDTEACDCKASFDVEIQNGYAVGWKRTNLEFHYCPTHSGEQAVAPKKRGYEWL